MYCISQAKSENIKDIQKVASIAWPDAFINILSAKQIVYMMEMMYSTESLNHQIIELGHKYYIVWHESLPIAYISIEHNCNASHKTKIHKAYILPDYRRQGIGKKMFDLASINAKNSGDSIIYLNVNKYNNKAISFYNKEGFTLTNEEVNDIGNGFVMDDYVFEKKL